MKLLPDTHILLWFATDAKELPREARRLLESDDHELFFSVASIWEVATKFALQRKDFTIDPEPLRLGLLQHGFQELDVQSKHAMALRTMPHVHRDPFDRMLVAQCLVEGLTLLTADRTLSKYAAPVRLV
ncbi:type II toxin-antitoxin system VapC family toxin [Granulicella cerasi]|uniref:Type II toxin-antitoxin system VapC family toxin n=1 Tax=Granulicella cerasi TaxID=741063 RepID=A0ABW1Z920_9BACT|nr:type II toxin-antitoxin system VapC family toxin [Granulicella cerasi]